MTDFDDYVVYDFYTGQLPDSLEDYVAAWEVLAEQFEVKLVSVTSRPNTRHDPPLGCNILRVVMEGTEENCFEFVSRAQVSYISRRAGDVTDKGDVTG
jgi:hypothetical protein